MQSLHNMARRGCRKQAFWINSLTSSGSKVGNWFHLVVASGWTWHHQCWTTAPVSPRYRLCTLVCLSLSSPLPVWLPWKGQPTGSHLKYSCLKDDCFTWLSTNTSNDHTKVSNSWSLSNRETLTNPATPYGCTFPLKSPAVSLEPNLTARRQQSCGCFPTGTIEGTSPMVSHIQMYIIYIYIIFCDYFNCYICMYTHIMGIQWDEEPARPLSSLIYR